MATTTAFQPQPPHELRPNDTTLSLSVEHKPANPKIPVPRGSTSAQFFYYEAPEDGSKPYNYVETQVDRSQRNYGIDEQIVQINDLRDREEEFSLDNNAFAALKSIPSAMTYKDWDSDAKVEELYYPEVEKLLLDRLPGAHRIVIFDHTIRRSGPEANRAPVLRVHIDQTPSAAASRVRRHASENAEELLRGRYRIVNVWRPLNGPVYAHPLAVADSSTVRDEDLIPVEHRYPDRTGETAAVRHHPDQKWYYWSGMTNEERLLLKCFDSDETYGLNGRVPHTAFVDPNTPEGAPGRESIEVRTLVFG